MNFWKGFAVAIVSIGLLAGLTGCMKSYDSSTPAPTETQQSSEHSHDDCRDG